jgi:hypothetical protein
MKLSFGKLLLYSYTSSALIYLVSLIAFSTLLKNHVSDSTAIYLLILMLAVSMALSFKISQGV